MVHYSSEGGLDAVLGAIADPTRRSIMERLARGPATISDLSAPYSMTLTGFCKHVRVLERAGLVTRCRQGRETTLELSAEPLREVANWAMNYEQFWNTRLDAFAKHFRQHQKDDFK